MATCMHAAVLLLAILPSGCSVSQIPGDIAATHIEANVSQGKLFDEYMKRDLAAHLCSGADCHVEYEMLRNGATQTGIAYAKFYVWVRGFQHGKEFTRGAARVAAIDREQFHVTDFLSREDILRSPEQVGNIFPAPLVTNILERVRTQPK